MESKSDEFDDIKVIDNGTSDEVPEIGMTTSYVDPSTEEKEVIPPLDLLNTLVNETLVDSLEDALENIKNLPTEAGYLFEKELFFAVRSLKNAVSAVDKEVKRIETIQSNTLYDYMDDMGDKSCRTNNDTLLTRTDTFKSAVKDPKALANALDNLGLLESFTKTDFRTKKLNDLVKESLEKGEDLPEGLDFFVTQAIRMTPPRKAKTK